MQSEKKCNFTSHIMIALHGTWKPSETIDEQELFPVEQENTALSMDDFWKVKEIESFSVNISEPEVSAAITKTLVTPQFWDNKSNFIKIMCGYMIRLASELLRLLILNGQKRKNETQK